jgi:hypothetical protein
MSGCLYILAILICCVAAMVFVAAAYAHAASSQIGNALHCVVAAAFCIGALLLFTAKVK